MANKAVLLEDHSESVNYEENSFVSGDKAKKFQLWMSYIAALTARIEKACKSKSMVKFHRKNFRKKYFEINAFFI